MNLELDPRTIYEALKQCFNLIQDVSWVLVLQESILFMTQYLRYEDVNTQNTTQEGESGLQLMRRSPVLILIQSQFSKWMTFPSESGYLFDGLWQPPLSAVGDYLTGRTRGKEGGEREEEKAGEGSCSAVTIGSASESIPFVYRPFHSPLPVTSLVSVPLILPDI